MNPPLIVLGIDPGTVITGYGIIQVSNEGYKALDFGCICPPKKMQASQKYLTIFEGVSQLIDRFQPNAVSVETQFVYKNVRTALALGMARGAVMIAAARHGIEIFEYAPSQAKLSGVGLGSAKKAQVQYMIQILLNLSQIPEPPDAADALALALCHIHQVKYKSNLGIH